MTCCPVSLWNNNDEFITSQIISDEYRHNKDSGKDLIDPLLQAKLQKKAIKWIQKDPLINDKDTAFSIATRAVKDLCKYNKFAIHLQNNKNERQVFFEWIIKERNQVAPFVEFRGVVQKLINSNISGRIGAFGGKDLKIVRQDDKKFLTLPFEGKAVNISDDEDGETEVHLKGNYIVKLHEIYQIFEKRAYNIGNFEYFPNLGICNWNSKQLGWYNPEKKEYEKIDLTKEEWWEQLIPLEIITQDEASKRYENFESEKLNCDGKSWIASIVSTTDYLLLDAQGNHTYLQIAIPDGEGNYKIYEFGKFSDWYPETISEKLQFTVAPIKAVICYPDENRFNLKRDREAVSFLLEEHEGKRVMNSIKKDLERARIGELFYQIFSDNCIQWACKKLKLIESEMNRLCGIHIIHLSPRGFLGKLWDTIKALPSTIQTVAFNILFDTVGANQDFYVKKGDALKNRSLRLNPPWAPEALQPHPTVLLLRKRSLL